MTGSHSPTSVAGTGRHGARGRSWRSLPGIDLYTEPLEAHRSPARSDCQQSNGGSTIVRLAVTQPGLHSPRSRCTRQCRSRVIPGASPAPGIGLGTIVCTEEMMISDPTILLDGLYFPEGPRWHDGRLFLSDMLAGEVVSVDLEGHRETIVSVPNRPSGLGWTRDGRLLVVSMTDRRLLRLDPAGLVEVADLHALAPFDCNDMVVDESGRAYVGNFGFDLHGGEAPKETNIVMVAADGSARIVAENLSFPNGSVITPDGRTLIVAESFARRLTAFDIKPDGSLTRRRVWAQLYVSPDGICLDAAGDIWVAVPSPMPGGFLKISEGGSITERVDLDDRGGFACMLGGPDGRTLFMLEAFTGDPTLCTKGNGRIRIARVDTPHAGLP